jgi:drug/metabolite transporter (DMT)-like permease
MRTFIFLARVVLAGTGGEIAATYAMKRIGEVKDFAPRAVLGVLGRALRVGWLWAGIGLMTLAFLSLLALLSWADVSFVIPATALSYVVAALGARIVLGERLGPTRWTGILLVSLGVALVCAR